MNSVVISGRLTRDPEARETNIGSVCNFTIASDYMDKNGDKQADFVPCVAWGKTAESIAKYTAKGNRILVEGKVRTRREEYKGQVNYKTEVSVTRIEIIDWAEKDPQN